MTNLLIGANAYKHAGVHEARLLHASLFIYNYLHGRALCLFYKVSKAFYETLDAGI